MADIIRDSLASDPLLAQNRYTYAGSKIQESEERHQARV